MDDHFRAIDMAWSYSGSTFLVSFSSGPAAASHYQGRRLISRVTASTMLLRRSGSIVIRSAPWDPRKGPLARGRGSRRKHCSENTVPDRGTSSRHGPASYAMPPPSYRDEHDEHMLRIRPNGFIRGYAPAVIALSEPSARVERETQRD